MLYEFELSHNAMEAAKSICVKGEGMLDDSGRNFVWVARTSAIRQGQVALKTMASKAVL